MSEKNKRILCVVAVLALAAAFFALNVLTPLYVDDYSYCFTFTKEVKQRVTSLELLVKSQLGHYRYMNGRTVAHTLAQIYLALGKPVFNVVNTGAFLLLAWAMQALMTGKRTFSPPLFLFSAAGLWLFAPAFGQDFLWLTASCTYHHCVLFILLYQIPFRRACAEGESAGGWLRAALFFPLGVVTGWSQENAAVAMLVMTVGWMVVCRMRGHALRGWMFTGLAGNLVGLALMLLSPGQTLRLAHDGGMGGLGTWLKRALSITAHAGYYLLIPALVFLAAAVWRLKKDGWSREGLEKWLPTAVFLLGSLACAYSMILSPQFPARAWGPVLILTLITAGSALTLCPDLRPPRAVTAVGCAVVAVAVLWTYAGAARSLSRLSEQVAQRDAQARAAAERGEREVTLAPIQGDNRYNCYEPFADLSPNSADWPNTAIAMYYGLDAVHSTAEGGAGQ